METFEKGSRFGMYALRASICRSNVAYELGYLKCLIRRIATERKKQVFVYEPVKLISMTNAWQICFNDSHCLSSTRVHACSIVLVARTRTYIHYYNVVIFWRTANFIAFMTNHNRFAVCWFACSFHGEGGSSLYENGWGTHWGLKMYNVLVWRHL